ncbi:unnamed protein product, partial [Gongylonema pulchrum]|uniref:Uncharacterized protein n=1 Tax=Gongylonema pulchrum TaxID=637853 RepID=A0A183DLI2_9BILA
MSRLTSRVESLTDAETPAWDELSDGPKGNGGISPQLREIRGLGVLTEEEDEHHKHSQAEAADAKRPDVVKKSSGSSGPSY